MFSAIRFSNNQKIKYLRPYLSIERRIMKKICSLFALLILVPVAAAEITLDLEEEMNEGEEIEVLVQLEDSDYSSDLGNFTSIEEDFEMVDYVKVNLTPEEIKRINEEDYVNRLEPNYKVETSLMDSRQQISAIEFNSNPRAGENVTIAILDTGIDDHSFLDIKEHRDYTGQGLGDETGHGTHVAGIVNSQHPVYSGVSPGADVIDLKVLGTDGEGSASQVLRAMDWALKNDVDIASLSLGTTIENCNGQDAISRAVNKAYNEGMVTVSAAGNLGPENSTIMSPGCAESTITVGAVDKNDQIAPYSSRGPTGDDRIKPDVVAPGTGIVSTHLDDNWRGSSGTSMAAPHVTGQAAIIKSHDSSYTNEEVKQVIKTSTNDLGYPETYQGSGRVDIYNSNLIAGNLTRYPVTETEPKISAVERAYNYLVRLFQYKLSFWERVLTL